MFCSGELLVDIYCAYKHVLYSLFHIQISTHAVLFQRISVHNVPIILGSGLEIREAQKTSNFPDRLMLKPSEFETNASNQ